MKLYQIILSLFLISCKVGEKPDQSKIEYFEGVVQYELEFEPKSDKILESRLQELYGAKVEMLFKNGDYVKNYYSSSGALLRKTYLDLIGNKSYSKDVDNDTIYWVNIARNDSKTTFKRTKDSLINNHPTIVLKTSTIVAGPGFGNKSYEVEGTLYFSKEYLVNPVWYVNYLEGNFNEQIKVGKGIQLLYISENGLWKKSMTAVSIEPKKIKGNEIKFTPPINAILKEL